MSHNTNKDSIQSLSSLSVQANLKDLRDSQGYPRDTRKSSFDLVNIFKDSDQFVRKEFKNSLDLLNSNIALNQSPVVQGGGRMVLQLSDNDKIKIEQAGLKPVEIGQVQSESDYYQGEGEGNGESSENDLKLEAYYNDEADDYKPKNYFPEDLADFLKEKEIPLEYVYGLLFVRDKREIKSVRRLKVERYLEKRRKKTWNRKICYNCRQKVAEERLRIKGKFIKKRRAMQILGLTTPISMAQLKKRLEQLLIDKNQCEIEQIIKKQQ